MFAISQDDLNSAARGLRMVRMSVDELKELAAAHEAKDMFASAVIAASAKQILAVKQFNGARATGYLTRI